MCDLNSALGITTHLSTAYHPQTDGQTERINQEVEQYLHMYCNYCQSDWSEWLSLAEFCYNNHQSASTRETPFYLNYGKNPRMGIEPVKETTREAVKEFTSKMN